MDYGKFMSPGEKCVQYPNFATILINTHSVDQISLTYGTESHRIAFEALDTEEMPALHNLVQTFQTLLKEPPLNVTFIRPSVLHRPFLQSLGDQNIRAFVVHQCNHDSVDAILSAIGENSTDALADSLESATNTWPFESLKFLTIYNADLNVSQVTRLVGIRQQYLRENSKRWLEEIVLVNCRLKGMRLAKAVKQLAAIGVTLDGIACLLSPMNLTSARWAEQSVEGTQLKAEGLDIHFSPNTLKMLKDHNASYSIAIGAETLQFRREPGDHDEGQSLYASSTSLRSPSRSPATPTSKPSKSHIRNPGD
ncbi:hypothetical protein FRC00_007242 [Tulasnella sp. 408]|nr:hypothetical protein FRC00_007242 [Tulasnella sp. 408]